MINDIIFNTAYAQAQNAYDSDEVPIGAVVFHSTTHEIITTAHNQTETRQDPTAHAEVLAIRAACAKLGVKRLDGYSLFTTLEPCAMCAGAIAWAHLDALYYGASDTKSGAIEQGAQIFKQAQTHHKPILVKDIQADKCSALLTNFFKQKRQRQKERKQVNGNS